MPELNDLLSTLREDASTGPVPDAALVRRRGDVLRRRRRAAAGAGVAAALLAVGAVAVPALRTADGDRTPPVATQPARPAVTTIPDDLPLTAGMPDGATAGDATATQVVGPCGTSGLVVDGLPTPTAARTATWTDPSEGGLERTLSVYRDRSTAAAALAAYVRAVEATDCARGDWRSIAVPIDGPNLAFAVRHVDSDGHLDGEGWVSVVEVVGNAVLTTSGYTLGAGDPDVLEQAATRLAQRDAAVLAAMRSTYGD